jgi:hypothetical protein
MNILTSYISNAKYSDTALLNDTALVREERDSTRRRSRGRTTSVRKVVAGVRTRLVWSLLNVVSIVSPDNAKVAKTYCSHRAAVGGVGESVNEDPRRRCE